MNSGAGYKMEHEREILPPEESIESAIEDVERSDSVHIKNKWVLLEGVARQVSREQAMALYGDTQKLDARYEEADKRYRERKQERMQKLRDDLGQDHFPIDQEKFSRHELKYNSQSQEFYVEISGKRFPVDTNHMDSDMVWGVRYNPSSSLPANIYAKIKKKVLVTEARSDIFALFNEEIARKSPARHLLQEQHILTKENGLEILAQDNPGVIAELMVREMLMRQDDALYSVERPTPLDDFVFSFDFKIKVSPEKTIGVQTTVLDSQVGAKLKAFQKTTEQYSEVLSSLNITDFHFLSLHHQKQAFENAFVQWLEAGKPPGGPEGFIKAKTREAIQNKVAIALQELPGQNSLEHISKARLHFWQEKLQDLSGAGWYLLGAMQQMRKELSQENPAVVESLCNAIEPDTEKKAKEFLKGMQESLKKIEWVIKNNKDEETDRIVELCVRMKDQVSGFLESFPQIQPLVENEVSAMHHNLDLKIKRNTRKLARAAGA